MSHYDSVRNNQQTKVHFGQYLADANEPREVRLSRSPADVDSELVADRDASRLHIRHLARQLRSHTLRAM